MRKFYKNSRDDIEEVSPDEWDLEMLNEIKNTPEEQQSYITQEQLLAPSINSLMYSYKSAELLAK